MKIFVDIGNTKIKFASYDTKFGDIIDSVYQQSVFENALPNLFQNLSVPERIIGINVAGKQIENEFIEFCDSQWSIKPVFLKVSRNSLGVKNGYQDFDQMGVDRWMAIIAAWCELKSGIIVIDCGTAVTIDIVNEKGEHLGGYIIPGDHMMKHSLVCDTNIKFNYNIDEFDEMPGKSTNECITNGVGMTIVSLITYVYNAVNKNQQSNYKCFITGGGAKQVMQHLSIPYDYRPKLVFEGMKLMYEAE